MRIPSSLRPSRTALVAAVAFAFASSPALAAAATTHAGSDRADAAGVLAPLAPAPAAPLVCGLMAFLDPDTGLLTGPISWLVPPAEQRAAAAPVLLEEVPLSDGGWMVDLKGSLMESYVVRFDAFGHRTDECVQDHRDAPIARATEGKGR